MSKGMNASEALTRKLIERLEDSNWAITEYTCTHKASGLSLWIANGALFMETCPVKSGFNLWQRYRLWRAFRRASARAVLMKLEASTP